MTQNDFNINNYGEFKESIYNDVLKKYIPNISIDYISDVLNVYNENKNEILNSLNNYQKYSDIEKIKHKFLLTCVLDEVMSEFIKLNYLIYDIYALEDRLLFKKTIEIIKNNPHFIPYMGLMINIEGENIYLYGVEKLSKDSNVIFINNFLLSDINVGSLIVKSIIDYLESISRSNDIQDKMKKLLVLKIEEIKEEILLKTKVNPNNISFILNTSEEYLNVKNFEEGKYPYSLKIKEIVIDMSSTDDPVKYLFSEFINIEKKKINKDLKENDPFVIKKRI